MFTTMFFISHFLGLLSKHCTRQVRQYTLMYRHSASQSMRRSGKTAIIAPSGDQPICSSPPF